MIDRRSGGWGLRLSRLALVLGVGAPLAALIAAVGAGQDLWDKLAGLAVLRYAFFVAIGAVVLGLAALIVHWRRHSGRPLLVVIGLAAALAYIGYIGAQVVKARSVPFIHDATTDLADPPAFEVLPLRADNLEVVPDGGRAELKVLTNEERWRRLHAEGYPDLQPVRLALPVPEAVALVERLARERGWTIAVADRSAGRVEATASVSLFRFQDDVVFRIRPAVGGSMIDIRSVSRLGVSDLGVNANRIRDFAADLKAASAR